MVKIVDRHGRGYDISVWDSIIPSHDRPAVRAISTRTTTPASTQTSSQPNDRKKSDGKEKACTCSASPSKNDQHGPLAHRVPKAAAELGNWTSEHDDLLLKLKDTHGKKWVDIVILLEQPKRMLVQRYAELKSAQEPRVSPFSKILQSVTPDSTETTDQEGTATVPKAVNLDDDNWSATDPTDYISDSTENPPVLEIEGEELNLREMHMVVRLNDYLDNQKWLLLASKLFDKTGKRLTAEALKLALTGGEG